MKFVQQFINNLHLADIHSTLPITKKYVEILLHYRWLFIKGDVFIGERDIFGAEVFLHYKQFFIKSNFVIGRVEYICSFHINGKLFIPCLVDIFLSPYLCH